MNKTAIKNFAIWARNKLIADITYKAGLLGVTDKEIKSPLPQSTQTVQFFEIGSKDPYSITGAEIEQRKKLVEEIQDKANESDYETAYKNVVEEVAYTWFNRLVAVRFMEVNDYLPIHIRVLSSESSSKAEPDLVTHPMDADLDYTPYEKDRIMQLKNENKLEELFRLLFIKQCNTLNEILPELFEKTNDYTELLMNVSFTDNDGVVYHLVYDIAEADFDVDKEGQVEIIGWMYQYYNTEPKNEVFALLNKNVKITKERIPAATQLFTPDWIVRYMVENSLGRLWLEGHPNDEMKSNWKYYLDESEQEDDVQKQLNKMREEYKTINPEKIKVIDPCMGSGHILVYAFDVLMQIYESYGYSQRDAAKSIVENNLYGLDIDNRAYQLAYFAVMMKARQYNRRILDGKTICHVYAIQESNGINRTHLRFFGNGMSIIERNTAMKQALYLLEIFTDAKEYGSILNMNNCDWQLLYQFVENIDLIGQMTLDAVGINDTQNKLHQLFEIASLMAQKYDVVITNPPYMGSSGMGVKLAEYVKDKYPDSKSDLFAIFIERCGQMTKHNGYQAMITQHSWMFLFSYEKLRRKMLLSDTINMAHLGARAFEEIGGEVVQTTSWVVRRSDISGYKATYSRLVDFISQKIKEEAYLSTQNRYIAIKENFSKIPSMPIAYWVSNDFIRIFSNQLFYDYTISDGQNVTSDNSRFVRYLWEVSNDDIGKNRKWRLYAKGGGFRKWYGNLIDIIDWSESAIEFYHKESSARVIPEYLWYKKGITWGLITSNLPSFRLLPEEATFDKGGSSIFLIDYVNYNYFIGLLNSKVFHKVVLVLNPTLNFQVKDIRSMPIILNNEETVNSIIEKAIEVSKIDWDSFEISSDFITHPLIQDTNTISESFIQWQNYTENQFNQLKSIEEKLNKIFIDIYGLQDEMGPDIEDKDITIRRADLGRDIRSFISYAVGCLFGRYSLDEGGLIYSGGKWDVSKYITYIPDKDNILPITDQEYFQDDIVGLFCTFLKKLFGAATLEENLDYIAQALVNKGNSSREIIRNYFLKDFFKDHCKIYQNRPIYWFFDSGKENGFKALVYMHRYNVDTVGNLRIDYLHRMQRVYENEISRMQESIDNSKDAREVSTATKRKEKLVKQLKETKGYDEKIAHLALARIDIDLDDGVKVNYLKVQTDKDGNILNVLAKI